MLKLVPALAPWVIFLAVLMHWRFTSNLPIEPQQQRFLAGPFTRLYLIFLGSNLVFYALQASGGMIYGGDSLSTLELALRSGILVFVFALAIILNLRSAESDREQGRLAQELAAAAEVQSLMLPGSGLTSAETAIDAVYHPASEVGGDFYQIFDRPDGTRLALVGDVSGKGLKAAMLVSVAIGALRREKSSSPAAILSGLNESLLGQGGFVTCCCIAYQQGGGSRHCQCRTPRSLLQWPRSAPHSRLAHRRRRRGHLGRDSPNPPSRRSTHPRLRWCHRGRKLPARTLWLRPHPGPLHPIRQVIAEAAKPVGPERRHHRSLPCGGIHEITLLPGTVLHSLGC